MNKIVIGIGGNFQSGKDTVAKMINYILKVGINKANFKDWQRLNTFSKESSLLTSNVIHYADGLKNCASIIFNINRNDFDNTDRKDNYWYSPNTCRYYEENEINKELAVFIDITDLTKNNYRDIVDNNKGKMVYIKLRTILQYLGTNVVREKISDTAWINNTISNAKRLLDIHGFCIIADVRFNNESRKIRVNPSFTGRVIRVVRSNNVKNSNSVHASETDNYEYDDVIENNTNLFGLFHKVLKLMQTIIKEML